MMSYISRYGFEYNPFIKDTREVIVETSQYREIKTRLDTLLQFKGFGLLTGQPGMGKTTAVRNWANGLNQAAYKVIYISLSTLTVMEFYRMMAEQLGYEPSFRKNENFRIIQSAIERYVIEKRMIPIFILDEANYMRNATLNDLKIIFNFKMDSINRAVVLLAGLPQLNITLRMASQEPLAQRITMNYTIRPLTVEESKAYLLEKQKKAGSHMEVFEDNALEAIAGAANGIPRMLDKIANRSLMIGNSLNQNIITTDIVMKTIDDIQI